MHLVGNYPLHRVLIGRLNKYMHDNMNKEAWEIFKSIMYGSIKKGNPLKG
jgi:hypothetical protein